MKEKYNLMFKFLFFNRSSYTFKVLSCNNVLPFLLTLNLYIYIVYILEVTYHLNYVRGKLICLIAVSSTVICKNIPIVLYKFKNLKNNFFLHLNFLNVQDFFVCTYMYDLLKKKI